MNWWRTFREKKERQFYANLGAPAWWIEQQLASNREMGVCAVTIVGEPWKVPPLAIRPERGATTEPGDA